MPRTARASVGGICYHVLNRGNARADVFHKDGDFAAFVKLIASASERLPMRVLAYCLLNNHFHLVLRPHNDGDLSRWMQWLLTSHVRRYHRHYHSNGHVWQGFNVNGTGPITRGNEKRDILLLSAIPADPKNGGAAKRGS